MLRRLSAIHVAHRVYSMRPGLEKIRRDIVGASEGHEDGLVTRRLIERERAVAAKMKRLAAAVDDFHRIVCTVPETSAEFCRAEKVYLQVLEEVRLHEEDWLAEFVLELADVLAEWSVPRRARNSKSIASLRGPRGYRTNPQEDGRNRHRAGRGPRNLRGTRTTRAAK